MAADDDDFDVRAACTVVASLTLRRADVQKLKVRRRELSDTLAAVRGQIGKQAECDIFVAEGLLRRLPTRDAAALLAKQLEELDVSISREEEKLEAEEIHCRGLPDWIIEAAQ
jgi:hypothetical protein